MINNDSHRFISFKLPPNEPNQQEGIAYSDYNDFKKPPLTRRPAEKDLRQLVLRKLTEMQLEKK